MKLRLASGLAMAALAPLALAALAQPAHAQITQYTFNNFTFNGVNGSNPQDDSSGTVDGYFDFNQATGTIVNFDVTTTDGTNGQDGSPYTGYEYTPTNGSSPGYSENGYYADLSFVSSDDSTQFNFYINKPLGMMPTYNVTDSLERHVVNGATTMIIDYRDGDTGTLTGAPTPESGTAAGYGLLLAAGGAALALARRRNAAQQQQQQ